MKLYEPKVQVRLIKAFPRKEIVPDVPVALRYGLLKSIDLTPYLGENGGVRTSKSVREPAGGFTITLADKAHSLFYETLYALIEPMDLVEIRMAHDPVDYAKPTEGYKPPVVMRGLVSNVTRSESMSGGKPVRTVTIAGQDFGKILQIIQIFFLDNSVVGDNLLTELRFFQKYTEAGAAKQKSAKEFVAGVLENVINPYLTRMTSLADGRGVGADVINKWSSSVTISGVVSPYSVAQLTDVSLHQFLSRLLDVGPFNELYVEDMEDGVRLVARPAPYLDTASQPLQEVRADGYLISDDDVVSVSLSRTDAGVANYFWVQNTPWALYSNEDAKRAASYGDQASFIKFKYLNSNADYYGVRKMEVSTTLLPDDAAPSDSAKSAEVKAESVKQGNWLEKRRTLLAKINKDNVIFEHGTIRVRGNEKIKAGMQVFLERGMNFSTYFGTFYVTKVDHEFVPFQGFYSTLTVERGTSFIDRSQVQWPQYFQEIDGEGVR